MQKQYRIIGAWGQWGEAYTEDQVDVLKSDLAWLQSAHVRGDTFRIEVREVTQWEHVDLADL